MTLPFILAEVPPNLVVVAALIAFFGMLFFCFLIVLMKQYRRCPSNRALVVYGKIGPGGQGAKVIHGGAAFVWPLLQDFAYLELSPFPVELELENLATADQRTARAAVSTLLAIDSTPAALQQAAIHLIGLSQSEIKSLAEDILRNTLRRHLTNLQSTELQTKREQLRKEWQAAVEPDLAKIGLKLIRADIIAITCDLQVTLNNS